ATPIPKGTRIEAIGIKGQFDLTWDCPVEEPAARTVFDVDTKCTVAMDGDRAQLTALQTIDAKQGSVATVRVRMPPGFHMLSGQQRYIADAKKYVAGDVDAAGFVKVDLKPVQNGRLELRWELEAQPQPNALFVIRGFDVENARYETGDVSI